eukprot:6475078-Amphidinium_carterae.3
MSGVVRVFGTAELGKLAQMTLLGELADWAQLARADVAGLFKAANGDARAAVAVAQGQKESGDKQGGTVAGADGSGCTTVRKRKMSSVLDVNDDGDVPQASPQRVAVGFSNYSELKASKGWPPMEDYEPSPEQISALHNRVVEQKLEPYHRLMPTSRC